VRHCSFRERPEDSPCPRAAYYLLELTSATGRRCCVRVCRNHVHKAWSFGQRVLTQRFPRETQTLRSIRLMHLFEYRSGTKRSDEPTTRRRERRASPRLAASFELGYLHGRSLTFTRSVNASESGLAFLSRTRFTSGTRLSLKLVQDPGSPENWISVESIVRRSDGELVGVEFSEMAESERGRLRQFLQPPPMSASTGL
jgi:PilZ domain